MQKGPFEGASTWKHKDKKNFFLMRFHILDFYFELETLAGLGQCVGLMYIA